MVRLSTMFRRFSLIALLCAVSLRLVAPPGWMPNVDGRPGSWLVICTAEGPHAILGQDDHARGPPDRKSPREPCAFAGLAFAPDPTPIEDWARTPEYATAAPSADGAILALGPGWRRPQMARGPPRTL
jgi:hypothetical protein